MSNQTETMNNEATEELESVDGSVRKHLMIWRKKK